MILEVFLFSIVLSVDSFSAAVALGFRHFSFKRAFAFAFSSGFSEGLATAIGFFLGHASRSLIADYDHWFAFALLAIVGSHMCYQAYAQHKVGEPGGDSENKVHGLAKIIFVSAVTSIDSLGVGVSLGISNKPIFLYSLCIGACAFLSTYLGLFLAKSISLRFGPRIEFLGGLVLILLGFQMLSI